MVKSAKLPFTPEYLRKALKYEPETGNLIWLEDRGPNKVKGKIAGTTHHSGYRFIKLENKIYLYHRIIWFLVTGGEPSKDIDHKNGDKSDNRWENLRLADNNENQANNWLTKRNTSGYKGIYWMSRHKRWRTTIYKNRIRYVVGYFKTKEEAAKAYDLKALELYGEFAKLNFSPEKKQKGEA